MHKEYDYLVVGAGLFGAVFAHQVSRQGKRCLVIDKRAHTGGNIYCESREGIRIHSYGAHIFHTDKEDIWRFVNQFVKFNHFINSPLAKYEGQIYNLPFNMNTFNRLWGVVTPQEAQDKLFEQRQAYMHIDEPANLEEQALKLCGKDIYEIFIKGYTEKQWGRSAKELPGFIIKRIPFRFTYDNNYFNDPYQGIPIEGYNQLINSLLENVPVRCDVNYFENREYFDNLAHKVLFTGCIDEYFNYEYGFLDYRSLGFEHQILEMEDFQGNAVVNYNEYSVPYTRIIEHKHFEFGKQPCTIITREYPREYEKNSEPYYPVNDPKNMDVYQLYKRKAETCNQVLFGGRLAQYSYFDMDDTIEAALLLSQQELTR